MIPKSAKSIASATFDSVRDYYDWRRRTLLTKAYFLYKNDRCITTTTPAGSVELEVDADWGRAYDYATGKMYEPLLLRRLYQQLSEDDVFYNIGGRWGIFSVFAEECGVKSQNIHTFEANDETFEILRRNVGDRQVINNVYVSDTDDTQTIRLDSYISSNDPPTVMKIDIEGAELKALRGAKTLLDRMMPELLIEVHPEYISDMGGTHEELIDLLTTVGYDLKSASTNSNDAKFEPLDRKSLREDSVHGNYRLLAV